MDIQVGDVYHLQSANIVRNWFYEALLLDQRIVTLEFKHDKRLK